MKNIHLILVNKAKASLYHCSNTRNFFTTRQTPDDLWYEMYITNDEEIKVGDWFISLYSNSIQKELKLDCTLNKDAYKKWIISLIGE